jgi:hypothetical protein
MTMVFTYHHGPAGIYGFFCGKKNLPIFTPPMLTQTLLA